MWACHFDKCENVEVLLAIQADDEMRFEVIDSEMKDVDVEGRSLLHWSVSRSVNKECFKVSSNYIFIMLSYEKSERCVWHEKACIDIFKINVYDEAYFGKSATQCDSEQHNYGRSKGGRSIFHLLSASPP